MGLAIHFHESADMAGHTDVLGRGVQMRRKITGMRRVAKEAVALFVGWMLDRVCGQGVACQAELIGRGGKSDIGRALDIGHRVADGTTHRDGRVDILSRGFVMVALKTFGRIDVAG